MTALTTSAMLVSLNISQWSARKHDKRVSSKVAREHNTSTDAGRYNKMLIAKEALKDVASVVSDARSHHYANTLPWADNGFRPPFAWVEEQGIAPACFIYLTDLICRHFPPEPDYPVVWAVTGNRTGPFGETLQIG